MTEVAWTEPEWRGPMAKGKIFEAAGPPDVAIIEQTTDAFSTHLIVIQCALPVPGNPIIMTSMTIYLNGECHILQ